MNFQQIKPACCDVFVWIAVWRDVIRYWVLSSDEVKSNRYYSSGQHRGNVGEGQLWLKDTNIDDFDECQLLTTEVASLSIPLPIFIGCEVQTLTLPHRSDIIGRLTFARFDLS